MEHRRGRLTLGMDGRWDIEDLVSFARGLEGVYGYFYAVLADDTDDHAKRLRDRIDDYVTRSFWNRPYGPAQVGERVYEWLPDGDGLKIASIRYASPGTLVVVGVLSVLLLMAKVVKAWTDAGSGLVDLYEKVDKFFQDRRHLARPPRNLDLASISGKDVDDAKALMTELGKSIGMSDELNERVLEMSGNPIAGLRFMVALALQARNVAALEERGLLQLPQPPAPLPPSEDEH